MKSKTFASAYWKEFIPKSWLFFQKKQYSLSFFKHDLFAGVTVGIVALPLAMAFAIASGVTPERGIYTAIIAGFLISFLGGSRLQVGGPTGAFVVIIYEIIQRLGYDGLVVATLIAGIILLIAAFSRFGALIKYIPYPLIIGFTTGIAVIIFSSQVKDFLGLQMDTVPADFIPKWKAIFFALPTFHLPTFFLAFGTLLFIILIRRFTPSIPWGITAVVIATLAVWGFQLPVESIASRFGTIPRLLPLPSLPPMSISFWKLHELLPDALTIAFLAGIEALLSAIVADGMAGTTHKSNCELMGQGAANIASVFFGGIPATGAIARTAMNIKTGAKTPLAGIIHSITIFLIILAFAPLVSQIPLAALSAILIMVAWNMSELHHFRHLFKAPPGDVIVLLTTFLLTVFIDLVVAIEVGMFLALFLFMKRMGTISQVISFVELEKRAAKVKKEELEEQALPHVEIYEITGPFFFGVADSFKSVLSNFESPPKVFILRMRNVPLIDASGMHALRELSFRCKKDGTHLFLSEVDENVKKALKKFEFLDSDEKHLFSTLQDAIKAANRCLVS